MQNQQIPTQLQNQYVYPEQEISLVDLWLVIARHQKVFWLVFGLVLILGLVAAMIMEKKYTVTTTIDIGKIMLVGKVVPLEVPETVKAKLENALVPRIFEKLEDEDMQGLKANVRIPKNSKLVIIQNKVPEDKIPQFMAIHEQIFAALKSDHDRMLNPVRNSLLAEIKIAEIELEKLEDSRFVELQVKEMESGLKNEREGQMKLDSSTLQALLLADREQQIKSQKQRLTELNNKLNSIIATKTVTPPTRSQKPTGISRALILVLTGILGVMLGLFAIFITEFRKKIKIEEQELQTPANKHS